MAGLLHVDMPPGYNSQASKMVSILCDTATITGACQNGMGLWAYSYRISVNQRHLPITVSVAG